MLLKNDASSNWSDSTLTCRRMRHRVHPLRVERRIDDLSVFDDHAHVLGYADVSQRVAFDNRDVCELSRLDAAKVFLAAKYFGGPERSALKRLHRRNADVVHHLHLIMNGKPGDHRLPRISA